MSRVITANFADQTFVTTERLWKGDYGQVLSIEGLELPEYYEVHFASTKNNSPHIEIGTSRGVDIPNKFLMAPGYIYAWLFLHEDEDDGETKYQIKIPVEDKGIPIDQETPAEKTAVQQAIEALNTKTEEANQHKQDSEAWAVGTRNGEPVDADDPAYENNSKYWADKSKEDAPVTSVNGEKGDVELTLDDIPDGNTYARATPEQLAQIGTNKDDIADVKAVAETALQPDDLIPYRTATTQDAIDNAQDIKINKNKDDIADIEDLIPNQATPQNQLADKDFVNSSINSSAAFFRGSFNTHSDLFAVPWQTSNPAAEHFVTNNDYAYVAADETHNNEAWRYTYVLQFGSQDNGWKPQFRVNETPLTAAQLAALNSGATAALINQISTNKDNIEQLDTNKQNKITASGMLKSDGNGIVTAAVAGTDYLAPSALNPYRTAVAQDAIDSGKQAKIAASGILKGDGDGGVSTATAGADYLEPSALEPYRTATDQDEIDQEQDDRINDLEQATTSTTLGPAPIVTFDASVADMPLKGLTVNIEPVQEGEGDPSPENVRPITGWTGSKVTHYGANLLDGVSINRGVYVAASGREQTSTGDFSSTDYVPISDDVSILTNFPRRLTAAISVAYYKASKVFISRQFVYGNDVQLPPVGPASEKLILPADAEWLRVNCYYNEFAHVAISDGDIDNINTPFPISAGTVYGGTLDVVNKKLTVDRVFEEFSNSDGFSKLSYANAYRYNKQLAQTALLTESRTSLAAANILNVADRDSAVITATVIAGNLLDLRIPLSSGIDTVEKLNDFLQATPLQIVYYLATPIVYDLSDISEILTSYGTNNIWADCGDVTVTYGAYLETVKAHAERLGDSILSAIAPLEASYTASRAYAVGEYLFVGTKFYKVTAPISSGDIITPGTNVTQTTVAEQLMELAGN